MVAMGMVLAVGDYEIGGEHYERVPRDFAADHPRPDRLCYAGLYLYSPH